MAEATKRPWRADGAEILGPDGNYDPLRIDNAWIEGAMEHDSEAIANAALIVRAVNGYEALEARIVEDKASYMRGNAYMQGRIDHLEARVRELEAALRWAMEHAEWSNDTATGIDPIRAALNPST